MGMASTGGYSVITWEGLWAWTLQMRIELDPWEADVLVMLSTKRVNILSEVHAAEMKQGAGA